MRPIETARSSGIDNLTRWWLAARPKTLSIALTPVMVGVSLAWAETGQFHGWIATATLATALLIQIGTNLHNDAKDFERGADSPARIGPARASAQGWFSPARVKRAAALSFAAAFSIGLYLSWLTGWEIFAVGILALAAGWAYTGGPRPIAYGPGGELFVLVFFGVVAVAGSYYLQTLDVSATALLTGAAVGLPAAAVLLVNNYRDLEQDQLAGRRTLVQRLGRGRARPVYVALVCAPFALPLALTHLGYGPWLTFAASPAALFLARRFLREPPGPGLNRVLGRTAQLQLAYGLLLTAGLLI
jgi:1,4-dihydroxy-2-naphthoate octaprenyltransferase